MTAIWHKCAQCNADCKTPLCAHCMDRAASLIGSSEPYTLSLLTLPLPSDRVLEGIRRRLDRECLERRIAVLCGGIYLVCVVLIGCAVARSLFLWLFGGR